MTREQYTALPIFGKEIALQWNKNEKLRYIIVFLLLGGCVVLLCVLNICIGSVSITVFDILASIQGKAVENARILWDIRMPRMLAALILGGALGLAGYLLQTFFA